MTVPDVRVGLLAYGAIGHEHAIAVRSVPGLTLAAVCDANPERLAAALEVAPDSQPFADATDMLDSGLIDLVVVSTPPNSHFNWAKQALLRGIHVILEKPMALTVDECDELMSLASGAGLLLVVYQNRRYDRDFVTLQEAVAEGLIGEVFQYDCFVGGYSEPCTYWHSDAAVSGGAIFDWGSHFLDQVLAIMKEPVDYVTGLNHKRHWMHVTNADHAQVAVTFTDGTQATFVNSDLAAARKPKFYVLGTKGAIVGDWDPRAEPAVADLPAILTLHRPDGSTELLDLVEVAEHEFHRSIVDYLRAGTPLTVSAQQSRDVVALMEAAEASARENGRPVVPTLLR
jgi:scyllo-inositol 2-dehydrogenase (NADP+)